MAAIDISMLKSFDVIFVFLFVWVIVYALLQKIKLLGDSKSFHALIALVFGILSLFSNIAVKSIVTAAPWFVLLIVFILFLVICFMALGAKEEGIMAVIKSEEYSYVKWWIVALVLIITVGSLAHVVTQEKGGFPGYGNATISNATTALAGGEGAPAQEKAFWKTMFHPKILGLIAVLIIAMMTISQLTEKTE